MDCLPPTIVGGYEPYPGSAAPEMVMEQGYPYFATNPDVVPVPPETSCLKRLRYALFQPVRDKVQVSYYIATNQAADVNRYTGDYASNFLYYRPHPAPYPYV